jgi:hypothetical protein
MDFLIYIRIFLIFTKCKIMFEIILRAKFAPFQQLDDLFYPILSENYKLNFFFSKSSCKNDKRRLKALTRLPSFTALKRYLDSLIDVLACAGAATTAWWRRPVPRFAAGWYSQHEQGGSAVGSRPGPALTGRLRRACQ